MQKKEIVETALDILDRDGLEGVTLRRLATELHIKAASIYWHILNKQVLLDEMANAILEDHFSTFDFENDQRDWAEWLDVLAHELRAAMLSRREGARVVAGAHLGIAVMLTKLLDFTIRVLHNSGFSYVNAATIAVTMTNFTFGSVIEEQSSPPLSSIDGERPGKRHPITDGFPAIAAAMEAWMLEDNDTHFDIGVRIIVNGVRAELKSLGGDIH
jgi:TetR/AcrR family tetracycline transcriptional repressor